MASDISESEQYVIDNDMLNVVEVTEMDGALLWDLLEELEEEVESQNNNYPKEAAADHNIIEGNNYNIISDNYGHGNFLKQQDDDDHEYSNWVDLMEISSSGTSNYNNNSLLLPSEEIGGAWYTDDDMVGINVDYYFGCNNIIGDYSNYYLYNNHGAATPNSYTTTDQIPYSLWEGC